MNSTIALAFFLETLLDPRAGGGPTQSMATSKFRRQRSEFGDMEFRMEGGSQSPGEMKATQKVAPAICLRGNFESLVETKLCEFRVKLHGAG